MKPGARRDLHDRVDLGTRQRRQLDLQRPARLIARQNAMRVIGLVAPKRQQALEFETDHLVEIPLGGERQRRGDPQRPLRRHAQDDVERMLIRRPRALMDTAHRLALTAGLAPQRQAGIIIDQHVAAAQPGDAMAHRFGHEARQLAEPPAQRVLQHRLDPNRPLQPLGGACHRTAIHLHRRPFIDIPARPRVAR